MGSCGSLLPWPLQYDITPGMRAWEKQFCLSATWNCMMRRYTLQQLKVIIITLDGFGTELLSLILSTDKQVYHSRLTYYFLYLQSGYKRCSPCSPLSPFCRYFWTQYVSVWWIYRYELTLKPYLSIWYYFSHF